MNSSPKTTVFPIFGVLAKRCTQWVSFDVPKYGKKVFVLFNRKCRLLSGILLSLLLAPSFCHGAEGHTFSFDKGLESWQVYGEGKSSHVVGIGHDAAGALFIEADRNVQVTAHNTFKNLAPGRYLVEGWVRGRDILVGEWNQSVWIFYDAGKGHQTVVKDLKGSFEWSRIRFTIDVGDDPVTLWFRLKASGRLWIDDLTLTPTTKAAIAYEFVRLNVNHLGLWNEHFWAQRKVTIEGEEVFFESRKRGLRDYVQAFTRFQGIEPGQEEDAYSLYLDRIFVPIIREVQVSDGQLNINVLGDQSGICLNWLAVYPANKKPEAETFFQQLKLLQKEQFDSMIRKLEPAADNPKDFATQQQWKSEPHPKPCGTRSTQCFLN